MSDAYARPFQELLIDIRISSPPAATWLEELSNECGNQLAFYGAFILLCLKASETQEHSREFGSHSVEYFHDFAFYEHAKGNERALTLFNEALRAYHNDESTP